MNFDALRRRVERAEQLVDGRLAQTAGHRAALGRHWRAAWTPGRIVLAGLAVGLVVAKARPLRAFAAVSATRWVQLATSLSGLFAAVRAAQSAEPAAAAGSGADAAAAEAAGEGAAAGEHPAAQAREDDGTPRPAPDARRRPDAQWESEPRPAEAATELSER